LILRKVGLIYKSIWYNNVKISVYKHVVLSVSNFVPSGVVIVESELSNRGFKKPKKTDYKGRSNLGVVLMILKSLFKNPI